MSLASPPRNNTKTHGWGRKRRYVLERRERCENEEWGRDKSATFEQQIREWRKPQSHRPIQGATSGAERGRNNANVVPTGVPFLDNNQQRSRNAISTSHLPWCNLGTTKQRQSQRPIQAAAFEPIQEKKKTPTSQPRRHHSNKIQSRKPNPNVPTKAKPSHSKQREARSQRPIQEAIFLSERRGGDCPPAAEWQRGPGCTRAERGAPLACATTAVPRKPGRRGDPGPAGCGWWGAACSLEFLRRAITRECETPGLRFIDIVTASQRPPVGLLYPTGRQRRLFAFRSCLHGIQCPITTTPLAVLTCTPHCRVATPYFISHFPSYFLMIHLFRFLVLYSTCLSVAVH